MKEIQKTAMSQEILNLKIPSPVLIFWRLHIQVIFAGDRFVQHKNLLLVLIYFILSWCLFADSLTFVVGNSAFCQFPFLFSCLFHVYHDQLVPGCTDQIINRTFPTIKLDIGGKISMMKINITGQKHCWKKLGQ